MTDIIIPSSAASSPQEDHSPRKRAASLDTAERVHEAARKSLDDLGIRYRYYEARTKTELREIDDTDICPEDLREFEDTDSVSVEEAVFRPSHLFTGSAPKAPPAVQTSPIDNSPYRITCLGKTGVYFLGLIFLSIKTFLYSPFKFSWFEYKNDCIMVKVIANRCWLAFKHVFVASPQDYVPTSSWISCGKALNGLPQDVLKELIHLDPRTGDNLLDRHSVILLQPNKY